jgi:recombination protein RecA
MAKSALKLKNTDVLTGADGVGDLLKAIKKDIKKDFELTDFGDESQEFLSTGNPAVNYAFSGRADGGFPVGRLSELAGENSTGKSLLAQHALVETQKKDGIAILVDTESAFNHIWYNTLGGDYDSVIHYIPDYIEQSYQFVKEIVLKIREKDKDVPITVVYDSIAALPSKYEFEGDMEKHDMGKRAIAHGKGVRLITGLTKKQNITFIAINQYRATMAMFGPEKDTTGGKAWKYNTSLRVDMKRAQIIKEKVEGLGERTVGIKGKLKVMKNRMYKPFSEAEFDIYFDRGIDPVSGLFTVLTEEGVITPRINEETGKISKGWWTYKDKHFQQSKFEEVLEEYPELLGGHDQIDAPDAENITITEYDDDDVSGEDADF